MALMKSLLLGLVLQTQSIVPVQAFVSNSYLSSVSILSISSNNKMSSSSSTTALDMARNRGLERREEGATPLRKSILYSMVYHV